MAKVYLNSDILAKLLINFCFYKLHINKQFNFTFLLKLAKSIGNK